MVHRTVKTINGRKYLYEQTSFRVSGQVKTVSKYIAPVSAVIYDTVAGVNGSVVLSNGDILPPVIDNYHFDKKVRKEKFHDDLESAQGRSRKKIRLSVGTDMPPNEKHDPNPLTQKIKNKPSKKLNLTPKKQKSTISVFTNLAKYNISEKSVHHESGRIFKILNYIGLPFSDFPQIKIVHGSSFSFTSKSFWSQKSVLTIPRPKSRFTKIMNKPYDRRKKVNRGRAKEYKILESSHRNQFYRAYNKALASSFLAQIEKHSPNDYNRFKTAFSEGFKAKNKSISSFLKATSKSYAQNLYYRMTGQVTQYYQAKRKPEFLGLSDWQPRKSWKDDFETIVSDIMKHGYTGTQERLKGDIAKVQASINAKHRKKANMGKMEWLSGAGRTEDKKILYDSYRLEAMKASYRQLEALHMPFFKVGKRGGEGF